ncbi:radical SAM family heme chaperone HemW [Candidatus Chromulinivorax destructor]|uniref:radical SAM family heme chaperone HemW n=1 Tax=Candidatus Chromulinivorax destructor TaxID=2066483 RepID=UPI0013B3EE18|nr:radical SAM family heme chaperone HemW [Candidatus Chromulinivorax destructor]
MSYYFKNLEHLYVHWPFCPYKCNFCDFVAIASHESFMQQYHESLCKEIQDFKDLYDAQAPLKTLYIGGGTPSTYPLPLILDMFAILKETISFDESTEVTLEVNPGTVEQGALEVWKSIGINRLSIGVQSLKDTVLQGLNRHQTKIDVINLLQKTEPLFENVSVDFIVGLPGVSAEEWKAMILQAMTWPIKHISVYFLMVHEKTPLYFKIKQKSVVLPPDDEIVDLYYWTVDVLEQHGFHRYELSNFAKKGFESKHNTAYWERKGYKGFGLGACSFNGQYRFQNNKNLRNYFQAVLDKNDLIHDVEEITPAQISMEKIMLGLRQAQGINIADVIQDFSLPQQQHFKERADWLEAKGFVRQEAGRLFLTPQGFILENEVAVNLFPE